MQAVRRKREMQSMQTNSRYRLGRPTSRLGRGVRCTAGGISAIAAIPSSISLSIGDGVSSRFGHYSVQFVLSTDMCIYVKKLSSLHTV